jgi:hypothetical protein
VMSRCCPLQRFARGSERSGPCFCLPWRWSCGDCCGVVCPARRCLGTDYWLPRCLAGGGREPLQAPGAMRRDSSPSKTPHLQVRAPLTRPERRRRGGRSLSRAAPVVRFPLLGFQRCPSVDISAQRPVPAGSTSRWSAFGQGCATSPAPSAPAVLPGFDGLLRCAPRRSPRSPGPERCCFKAADSQLREASLLQPTMGFMPFRLLPLCLRSSILSVPWFPSVPIRKDRRPGGRVRRCFPGHALPFGALLLVSSRPDRHRWAVPSRRYRAPRWPPRGCEPRCDFACVCRPQGFSPLPSP